MYDTVDNTNHIQARVTTTPAEIETRMRIMDGVIRYLCVKNEA